MNFRPSTSPTPYSTPDVRRNGARFRTTSTKTTHTNSPPLSQHHLPAVPTIAAAAVFSKPPLRPIDGRGSGSGMMFSMCVEGTKAGEEKAVGTIDKREASYVRPSATLETGIGRDVMAARDAQRLKRLEQELAKAQETIKKRTSERDGARSKNEEAQQLLTDLNARLVASEKTHAGQICDKDAIIARLREQLALLEARVKELERVNADLLANGGRAASLEQQLSALQARFDATVSELGLESDSLRSSEADLKARIAQLQSELRNSTAGSSASDDRLRRELDERTREAAKWQEAAKKSQRELNDKEALFSQWKETIDRVNKYIVKICQPQFSVVKDESLAPVTPGGGGGGSSTAEGFVLVPLALMLEGYTILPADTKKQIASEYESSKQRGLLPSGGSTKNALSMQIPRRPSGGANY